MTRASQPRARIASAITTLAPLACAITILAILGGCGLASRDPDGPTASSDGVSGFGDAQPIELCLGTARVVPLSEATTIAGLCVPNGVAGHACGADAECAGLERCICGRCVVEACQGAASCSDGRVCRGRRCTTACADDTSCAPGERCVSGGCARSCADGAACHFGETCDALDSVCSSKLCGGALACAAGDTCELERVPGEIREPAIVTIAGERLAFVEIRSGDVPPASAIYRARIDAPDRMTADPPEPVLTLPSEAGDTRAGAPSAIARGDALELYFTTGDAARIARATSSDRGLHLDLDPTFSFAPLDPWEAGRVGSPSVIDHAGATYLFYEGGDRAGIGVARITASSIERLRSDPVVSPGSIEDPLFWRGITAVGAPYAVVVDGVLRLYFTARGAEAGDSIAAGVALPADRNDSIGLVTTRDLITFDRYPTGPVFARVTNLRTFLGEREPAVEIVPGAASIVFVATDASGAKTSGLARAASR